MQRSSANGLSMMGLGLGGALSPPLVVWIVAAGGWPAPFWAFGISGALIAVILWRTASEWPEQHSSVNPAELALIRGSATPPQGAPPPAPWRKFAASPSVWALSLSYGVAAYTSYVFFTWFYLYLVNVRGMSRTAGGYWAGLPYVAVAMGTLLGGRLADRAARHFGKRAGLLSIALCGECLAAILILVGGRVPNITLGVVLLACATGLHLFGQTSSWAATVDLAPAHAGLLFGVMNTLAQIAGTIAPVATPAIAARFGWGAALDFSAAMVALAGLLWILVRPERPIA